MARTMHRASSVTDEAQALRAAFLAPAMRSAHWSLHTGAAAVPWVRRGGQALMLGSGAMAWMWALACWPAIWPVALALGWSWHLVRLWRAWAAPAERVLLCWRAAPEAGWCVPAWGEVDVQVRVLWDGQSALLLHLRAANEGRVPTPQAWLWVPDDGGRDVHRLRTLLFVQASGAGSRMA